VDQWETCVVAGSHAIRVTIHGSIPTPQQMRARLVNRVPARRHGFRGARVRRASIISVQEGPGNFRICQASVSALVMGPSPVRSCNH
jgi:hypothetical protein